MLHRFLCITSLSMTALLLVTSSGHGHAEESKMAPDSLFLLPVDAPEQKVVTEAQDLGLPIPRIALVPPAMVRLYAEGGRNAAETWCAGRATAEECTQAVITLQEGPFIDHGKGRIWLHASLPLSHGKSAPMLQELARQIGSEKARQVIIAHEIAHVAFRRLSVDQLEFAAREALDGRHPAEAGKNMFSDARFYEAFCNFFGVALVARLSPEPDADAERRRLARGLAEALRVFHAGNRFYTEMAYALDNWASGDVTDFLTWEQIAIHAAAQAARLSLDSAWATGE